MREIIFRGIRLDTKEFTYGYLWAKNNCSVGTRTLITNSMGSAYEVDPETLSQFTGLRDNKRTAEFPGGQEIFEGDIVKRKKDKIVRVVIFKDGSFLTERIKPRSRCVFNSFPFYEYDEWEVIGNIHEHRNLLDGEVD